MLRAIPSPVSACNGVSYQQDHFPLTYINQVRLVKSRSQWHLFNMIIIHYTHVDFKTAIHNQAIQTQSNMTELQSPIQVTTLCGLSITWCFKKKRIEKDPNTKGRIICADHSQYWPAPEPHLHFYSFPACMWK